MEFLEVVKTLGVVAFVLAMNEYIINVLKRSIKALKMFKPRPIPVPIVQPRKMTQVNERMIA